MYFFYALLLPMTRCFLEGSIPISVKTEFVRATITLEDHSKLMVGSFYRPLNKRSSSVAMNKTSLDLLTYLIYLILFGCI